jgi:hypothetical protein
MDEWFATRYDFAALPGRKVLLLGLGGDRLPRDPGGRCVVPRGIRPAVPQDWLTHGFVFDLRPR